MKRIAIVLMALCGMLTGAISPQAAAQEDALVKDVLRTLNTSDKVRGTDDIKSYKTLFDAYLKLSKPPFVIGPDFNLNTIHPKMSNWVAVSGWAESNPDMAKAILACKDRAIFGLPYGREGLPAGYVNAEVMADIGVGGSLRNNHFPYLGAVETIAAFATAETYRLMEAGQVQEGLDVALAMSFVLRQCCDRDFLAEKLPAIELLSRAMSNLRAVMHLYLDKISTEQFTKLALTEIPFLRPDRGRLFMPEADRVVAEALIKEVFNARSGDADPDKFTETFAEIQAKDAPLTRFGAAKRWRMIAAIHGSLDASQQRLKLIYDDWWRRWRIDAYDQILDIPTEFTRTNPIRYAAVIYSVENVAVLFEIRNRLIVEVNGTAMAAGMAAFKRQSGNWPSFLDQTYGALARKRSDSDPYDRELQPFKFKIVDKRQSVDTPEGRVWIEPGTPLMWSQGQDHENQLAVQHTDDGLTGDIVLWPPIKTLQREAGLIQ